MEEALDSSRAAEADNTTIEGRSRAAVMVVEESPDLLAVVDQ